MRAFLGVSVAPHATARPPRPSEAVLACLTDDDITLERVDEAADGWAAFAGSDDTDILGEPGAGFTVRLSRLLRTRDDELSTADVPAMFAAGSPLATLLPPFAAAHRDRAGAPVSVANDWLAYRQLFWWQGDGVAAVSTSARALAVLAGTGFDRAGLGAQAMIGWQVADRTVFAGVHAFPPATIATLAGARALECLASPMALAPLLLTEGRLNQGHRLSGLGGEVARGFYYAGQPTGAQTSPRLVHRLARWRIFSNEAVEEAALDAAFL